MRLFSDQEIFKAQELLKQEELVAFPTETVYGLGALISSEPALKKIYLAKGRPSDNPLIVHLLNIEDVLQVAVDIPEIFWKLAAAFSPGPLTFILKKAPHISPIISAGKETIAVRFPSHLIARELLKQLAAPIAAPSANLSGKPSSTLASHVLEDFEGSIAGVIDGGPSSLGLESTVINLMTDPPAILRPGTITKEEIENLLGMTILDKLDGQPLVSPGMKYRHYAPKTPIELVFNESELTHSPKHALLARVNNHYPNFFPLSGETLYALLRAIDAQNFDKITVFCDPITQQNKALMNRLSHASK